jgi:hypothetical protein
MNDFIKCYRIVEVIDGEYYTLFHGIKGKNKRGLRKLEQGKWLIADKKIVNDGSCGTYYESGFHVLKSKEQTEEFLQKMFRAKKDYNQKVTVDMKYIWLMKYIFQKENKMDQKILKIAIDDLREKIVKLREQDKRLQDGIVALQNICDHEFVPGGRDSHYNYEECKYCGIEQKT